MTEGIRITMTAEQKRKIRLLAIEANTTLSDLILQKVLGESSRGKQAKTTKQAEAKQTEISIEKRIKEINETLSKNGNTMTSEEREKLKKERNELKEKLKK